MCLILDKLKSASFAGAPPSSFGRKEQMELLPTLYRDGAGGVADVFSS